MQLLPMASSPDGLISARYVVITKTPGWVVLPKTSNVNVTQGRGGGGVAVLQLRALQRTSHCSPLSVVSFSLLFPNTKPLSP